MSQSEGGHDYYYFLDPRSTGSFFKTLVEEGGARLRLLVSSQSGGGGHDYYYFLDPRSTGSFFEALVEEGGGTTTTTFLNPRGGHDYTTTF